METSVSHLWSRFTRHEDLRIVMIGLDGAGKTTIFYKLKIGETLVLVSTNGPNEENLRYKNIQFLVWDIGGEEKSRVLWYHYYYYYDDTDAIIFVLNSSDMERIEEAKDELHKAANNSSLRNSTSLFLSSQIAM
ncbi:unnamed protein product [Blepharisma stoltei]|uniref:ADP-ribosylation factor n=1 Tax=Blepharisma stoltei TaxID=1481888 RepID=A0AAU9INU0_9CILI|nr:unnamed protein product [Blepharisma stoltei]